ncbi:hypothetical protein [uncultured Thiodictyon sp.]|uniref:hypothetical protein n=1 Tax=uncultured Thiodictyon sp. TaxID=1846217 RepID=UPI0025D3EB83|nr:hypothetical protein [uncultured Thiodictyon sp.]
MKITDEFLTEKADAALGSYFHYLAPALDIVRSETIAIGSNSETKLLSRYSHEQPRFQARASTLVLEAFHVIELILKALLIEHGEHLVFESLDDYLDRRTAAPKAISRRQEEVGRLLKTLAGSTRSKKGPPADALKSYINHLMRAPVENFGKSVSAQIAFKRLLHFDTGLEAALSEEVFTRLIGLRNQIVHFGEMANLLQGVADALRCLFAVCLLRPQRFPCLAQLPLKYEPLFPPYNELIAHLMLHEAWPQIIESDHALAEFMVDYKT